MNAQETQAKIQWHLDEIQQLTSNLTKAANPVIPVPVSQLEAIKEVVCKFYRVPFNVMSSRIRTEEYSIARHAYMWLARELTEFTLIDIGNSMRPNMSHGTVLHGCGNVADRIDTEPAFAVVMNQMKVAAQAHIEGLQP